MNKIKTSLLAIFLLTSACTIDSGQFNAISTKPISLYTLTSNNIIVAKGIKSSSSQHVAVVIPLSKAPTISDAINQILDAQKADYLSNVDIKFTTFRLFIWYSYQAWKIEGDAIRVPK